MLFSRCGAFALLCLATLSASAQKYSFKAVTFSGYTASSQADLLAASGLTPSGQASAADLQAAAQKLNQTGLFAHIGYKLDGQTLSFQIEPATGLLPARFDNFAWLAPSDINSLLHARVPLYNGKLIAGSGLEQQVSDALTAMATEQHLDAKVDPVPVVDLKTNQPVAESFRLASPAVVLSTLTLDGASPDQAVKLAPIVQAAAGQEYSLATSADTLTAAILNVYRNQGYLDARVTKINALAPSLTPDRVSVPMTATIDEGGQYRIGRLTLAGSVLMSQEEFQKKTVLKTGDVANQELLRRTLLSISSPYRNKGYIRAKIAAVPTLDAATHVASYAIDVTPGEQFRLGKVELANVTDTQRAQFAQVWKMSTGDPYDESYTNNFLVRNKATLHAFDGYSAGYKQYEHEDTHVVDLVVTFRKDAALQ